jgi:hypothetical protein
VSNEEGPYVTGYLATATGNALPFALIGGPNTGFNVPTGEAFGADGSLYVADGNAQTVKVFASRANGNVFPIRTLPLFSFTPWGITIDIFGYAYVVGNSALPKGQPGFFIFAPGGSTSCGGHFVTGINDPRGVAVDITRGNLYVSDDDQRETPPMFSVAVYPVSTCTFGFSPGWTIAGSNTGLQNPVGLALDSAGNLYVANGSAYCGCAPSITEYSPTARGNATPIRIIQGPNTGLVAPLGVAVDGAGNIFVSNGGASNSITVYSSLAAGNASPMNTISGNLTGIAAPYEIAIHP